MKTIKTILKAVYVIVAISVIEGQTAKAGR